MNPPLKLPAEARSLVEHCLIVFGPQWTPEGAAELHQKIESAADRAEVEGQVDVAESLLELSVFLCSLVDSPVPPSAALQSRVSAMCEERVPGIRDSRIRQDEAETVAGRALRVLVLGDPCEALLELTEEIGKRKLLVAQCSSIDALATEVARRQVAAVFLSRGWVDRAADAVAAIERSHPHALTLPGTIAVIDRGDRGRRMFALRAGVDQVLEAGPAANMADAIAAFVQKRRHSAFRVLIVEDDRGQAIFAQKVLGHRGMETLVAGSAEEALAAVDGFRPDLCLLDLNLPDRNGIELAQLLRERPGFELVQIVFLTGEADPNARALAVRLGADDWIVKPVRPRDLLTVVESRAERARRAAPHDRAGSIGREAARGVYARRRMMGAIASGIAIESPGERCVLVAVAPQLAAGSFTDVSWENQAELGGELARALRADGLVRSEVCQAETMCCLFIADPSSASQMALATLAGSLDRRQWLAGSAPVQLPFAVAGLVLDPTMTPHGAIDAVLGELRNALRESPRVRFQSGAGSALTPSGWPQLRSLFANDALSRAHRIAFHPLMPVLGSRPGQFLLRAEFEVQLGDGTGIVPDHRAFARSSGFHLRLDEWMLSRCLDWLRLAHGRFSLVVEVCPESIEDPALAEWLRAELQRRKISDPELTLLVAPERMRGAARHAAQTLAPFVQMGIRIGLGPMTPAPADLELIRLDEVQLLACHVAPGSGEVPGELLRIASEYGKSVLVLGVDQASVAGALYRQPIHYVCGAAISPPLPRPEYNFTVA